MLQQFSCSKLSNRFFLDRNPEYYGDEHLTSTSEGNLVHRAGVGAETYESPSISQPEVLNPAPSETAQGNQYSFSSSSQGFTYENTQQSDGTFMHPQASSQMQNLAPFSSVMVKCIVRYVLLSIYHCWPLILGLNS